MNTELNECERSITTKENTKQKWNKNERQKCKREHHEGGNYS